jgi:His-Xaa-Ser system radical SAM maturase HxsB
MPKKELSANFVFNKYRHKIIKNMHLLTTDDGSWVLLEKGDYLNAKKGNLDGRLFQLLEDEGIIITEKNEPEIMERLRKKYSFLSIGTSLHIIVPTLRCNMTCRYCQASSVSADSKDYDMSEKTAKKAVDFIFQSPSKCITIEFQGGEPMLNFKIVKYITEYARKLNKKYKKELEFVVVTNLNAMDEGKLNYLLDNDIHICTSLDGPKEIHDANRPLGKNGGSYDNVVKWVRRINNEYLKKGAQRRAGALITVTRKTLTNPQGVIDEYLKNGFDTIHLRFLSSLGCASASWQNIGYTPEEFLSFWKKAMEYIIDLNKKGILIRERLTMVILRKFLSLPSNEEYMDLRSPCGAAIGQLLYNYDGSIFTCDEGRMMGDDTFKIGDVDGKYSQIITSSKSCAIVSSSVNDCFVCDECAYKPYCGLCPVCNYYEQGSTIAKIPETPRCKIYMGMFDYIFNKYLFDEEAKKVFEKWLFS